MRHIKAKIISSEVIPQQAIALAKIADELGVEETKALLDELWKMKILMKEDKENAKHQFLQEEEVIKLLQKIDSDINEDHHNYLVDYFEAKNHLEYYRYGFFTYQWVRFMEDAIQENGMWKLHKAKYKFEKYERFKDDFPHKTEKEIEDKIDAYIQTEFLINIAARQPCVYVVEAEVGGKLKYKIRKTKNLKKSFFRTKKDYDYDLFLCKIFLTNDPTSFESILHKRFVNERCFVQKINGLDSNKWFEITEDDLKKVGKDYSY